MQKILHISLLLFFISGMPVTAQSAEVSLQTVRAEVYAKKINIGRLRQMGKDVLPLMADLYESSTTSLQKAKIAWSWYKLGWKYERAREVMMPDIHTPDAELRLWVQWALGRVSADPQVVAALVDSMLNDKRVLFRDKAACALASDQIHLSPAEKLPLFQGLIKGLDDPKLQVRKISIKALKIQTGQTKGYRANAQPGERSEKVEAWKQWLETYSQNL